MSVELWGTFSVRDHLADHAFVADVLLYDHLVIPTQSEDLEWPESWDFARQRRYLDDLGNIAIRVPWNKARAQKWEINLNSHYESTRSKARSGIVAVVNESAELARAAGTDNSDQAMKLAEDATRGTLADFGNGKEDDDYFRRLRATKKVRPGSKLEIISAYQNYDSFRDNVDVLESSSAVVDPHLVAPTTIFGWTFLVPVSEARGEDVDRRLLAKAAKLAGRADYIEMRGEFYKWLSDVSEANLAPVEAQADMELRLKELTKLLRSQRWPKVARRVLKVTDAFSGVIVPLGETAEIVSETFCKPANILLDGILKEHEPPGPLRVAAIFHDARSHFGWQPTMSSTARLVEPYVDRSSYPS